MDLVQSSSKRKERFALPTLILVRQEWKALIGRNSKACGKRMAYLQHATKAGHAIQHVVLG